MVLDASTKAPLEMVGILEKITGDWTVTDREGKFSIRVNPEQFELYFKLLGKEDVVVTPVSTDSLGNLRIYLKANDLRLDEVTVVAGRMRDKTGSAIILDKYAIEQFQALSLSDVLSQLPAMKIGAPVMSEANTISLRTASSNTNNAFGVSYIIDDMQVSNDENMQVFQTGATLTAFDNANTGVDLRSIPASNIDDVEVISGIPDARYGNLTSGIVKINRKAGESPLSASANIREGSTSLSVNKGTSLGGKRGTLSLSLDYLNSNVDPRQSLQSYNRVNLDGIWSTGNGKRGIKNTLSLSLHRNFDNVKYDENNDDGGKEARHKKEQGFTINERLSWSPKWILMDRMNVQVGFSLSKQDSYTQSFRNDGAKVVPIALETALMPGLYTPVAYLQKRQVEGIPINLSYRLEFAKSVIHSRINHNISYGSDASFSDNRGRGRIYDAASAHQQTTLNDNGQAGGSEDEGIRGENFGDNVKPQIKLGIYAQDNISIELANRRSIFANIGIRYDNQSGYGSFGPRINVAYEHSPRFKIRGGLGFASKAPSLSELFPGDKYFDVLMADYRTNYYSYNLVQTYRKRIEKQSLKSSKSWKYEAGADLDTKLGRLSLTTFYNHSYDGFASHDERELVPLPLLNFTFTDERTPPTYKITGTTPYTISYSLSANDQDASDKGVEVYMNFKKIHAINTTISLAGTYITTRTETKRPTILRNSNPLEQELVWGYYSNRPNKTDLLKLRITFSHHIPSIGLLTSVTVEQFTRSTTYATFKDRYPYAYENGNLEYFAISEEERSSDRYSSLFLTPSSDRDAVTPVYHNFHLRLTKEMLNGLSVSLYATNFLGYRPFTYTNGSYTRQNEPISFGGNIKYTFD